MLRDVFRQTPSQMFTEDYQVDFLREHHHVFDDLRSTFLSGEMVWNFADFMTGQGKCCNPKYCKA